MSTARKVNRSESVLIETQNEVDCEASKSTNFSWEIFNISDDPVNYRSIVSSAPVKTGGQPYYNLAAKSLSFGFYKLQFKLTMEGVTGISGSADGFIHVVATRGDSLKAVIEGGPRKRYKFGTTVRIACIEKNEARAARARGMTLILASILPCAFHSSFFTIFIFFGIATKLFTPLDQRHHVKKRTGKDEENEGEWVPAPRSGNTILYLMPH